MNQYMMDYLVKRRTSDRFRGFSYRKTLIESRHTKGYSKVIAWDVYFENDKLTTLDSLKQVKYFIETKIGEEVNVLNTKNR